jgi:3-dehydroquinate synthase class II
MVIYVSCDYARIVRRAVIVSDADVSSGIYRTFDRAFVERLPSVKISNEAADGKRVGLLQNGVRIKLQCAKGRPVTVPPLKKIANNQIASSPRRNCWPRASPRC